MSCLAGLVSRELARISEEFIFTIGVGDDFVMRLSVDSIENLRTRLLMVLRACRLPKVSSSSYQNINIKYKIFQLSEQLNFV